MNNTYQVQSNVQVWFVDIYCMELWDFCE